MERLIGAILLKAIDDWDDPKNHSEIEDFLESEWFDELVEVLNLEPATVRNRLRTGNYDRRSIRAAYR
jgi:hypothetical protein